MGSWCVDPTKPLAFVDSCGKRLLVCPARRPTKPDRVFEHLLGSGSTTADTSPQLPFSSLAAVPNEGDFDNSDLSSQGMVSPMFGPPNPLDSILSDNNFIGTSKVYSDYKDTDLSMYGDLEYDDDDDDHEDAITMEDLFNISSDETDSEVELEGSRPSSSDSTSMGNAAQGSRNMLDHLDSGVITAFRQSQQHVKQGGQHLLQPANPLRKRKASPSLHGATRRRIAA